MPEPLPRDLLDRAPDGPIAKAWRVEARPATFLIDEGGVSRSRDLAFDTLETKVAEMLKKQ